jgi:hypothetical protein
LDFGGLQHSGYLSLAIAHAIAAGRSAAHLVCVVVMVVVGPATTACGQPGVLVAVHVTEQVRG